MFVVPKKYWATANRLNPGRRFDPGRSSRDESGGRRVRWTAIWPAASIMIVQAVSVRPFRHARCTVRLLWLGRFGCGYFGWGSFCFELTFGSVSIDNHSAVDKPKLMGRPPDHPWWKTGSPKSFFGCLNYFDWSLKDICFLVINTKLARFPFNHAPTYRELGRPSGDFGCHVGSPNHVMGRIWRLGDHLPTALQPENTYGESERLGLQSGLFCPVTLKTAAPRMDLNGHKQKTTLFSENDVSHCLTYPIAQLWRGAMCCLIQPYSQADRQTGFCEKFHEKTTQVEFILSGCNVMIASRKLDRLVEAKEHLTASLSAGNRLEYTQCNVRNEDQVLNHSVA